MRFDMPTETQERPETQAPESERGFLRQAWDIAKWTMPPYWLYRGGVEIADGISIHSMQSSDNPSSMVFDRIANMEGFNNEEGKKLLDEARNDQRFVAALNNAIKNDPSVAYSLVKGEGRDAMNPQQLLQALGNTSARTTFGDMLNKVAEKPDDKYNFAWMTEVTNTLREGELGTARTMLAEAGIRNTQLDMAADPLGAIGNFLNNPEQGLQSWLNDPTSPLANLSGQSKNILGMIVEMFSGFLKGFAPGGGFLDEFRAFGSHYFGAGGQFDVAGHNKGYDGSNPVRADGNNIEVAENMRPARGGAFASAAGGEAPRSAPQELIDRVRVEHPELQQQTMGGASFRLS
jgi:hypothetical protein